MLWFIFWVRKVTCHSVCMYVHVILLHCFPSLVFMFNLNKLWTDTLSRNYIVEKKKERHFIWVCMFCFHESAYWGQYLYVSNWRRDWHFTWSSEPCEGLAICRVRQYNTFISQSSDLSIGLTLGDEPMPYILQPWMHLNPKNLLGDQNIPFGDHL